MRSPHCQKAVRRRRSFIRNCSPEWSRRLRLLGARFGCSMKTGKFGCKYQINAEPSILAEDTEDAIRHRRLIQRAANGGQSLLVPPYSGTTDGDPTGNPTRFLLVLGALQHEDHHDGLIEVFQRPDTAP